MTTDIKELVKRLREVETRERILGFGGSETLLLFSKEAADALEAMAGEVERLKRMLFPYAEDKEISGMSWDGFYLIGNKKSIDELKRMENRSAQLETYRAEFVRRNEAAEAERDRLQLANARMKAALVEVEDRLNCRGNPDIAHYCPNCDNSLHNAREIARKALGGDA